MQPPLSLSVIVPATDGPDTLARCLSAIHAADAPPDEVIVVSEPSAAGPAHARNAGAERARGDVLAFVDSDVEVHPDVFARMRAAFASDPLLAALFGSYDDAPPVRGAVSGFRNLLHHHVHQTSAGPAATFWAGLGAVRRGAFERCGGFDELRFPFASVEDVDLGMRINRDGGRCVLDPTIQGTHLKEWTLGSMVATDFARRALPWTLLLLRAGAGGADARGALNTGPRHRASAALAVAGAAAVPARRPLAGAASLGAMAWLNRDLYRLIARRRGRAEAGVAVALHAIHHLSAVAALPAAAAAFAQERAGLRRRPPREQPDEGTFVVRLDLPLPLSWEDEDWLPEDRPAEVLDGTPGG